LKPHETNQLAAGLLAPLFVAALMFVWNVNFLLCPMAEV
jgi:hypothetical protein